MKLGVHRDVLAAALAEADESWVYSPDDLGWDVRSALAALGGRAHFAASVDALAAALAREVRAGDHVVVMSNGGFGGFHDKLLAALAARNAQ
jgi:UDP-N-acetylmuramate: L-alanyl-gamma-D-glutamyl-meso-diaminopimelate ligase